MAQQALQAMHVVLGEVGHAVACGMSIDAYRLAFPGSTLAAMADALYQQQQLDSAADRIMERYLPADMLKVPVVTTLMRDLIARNVLRHSIDNASHPDQVNAFITRHLSATRSSEILEEADSIVNQAVFEAQSSQPTNNTKSTIWCVGPRTELVMNQACTATAVTAYDSELEGEQDEQESSSSETDIDSAKAVPESIRGTRNANSTVHMISAPRNVTRSFQGFRALQSSHALQHRTGSGKRKARNVFNKPRYAFESLEHDMARLLRQKAAGSSRYEGSLFTRFFNGKFRPNRMSKTPADALRRHKPMPRRPRHKRRSSLARLREDFVSTTSESARFVWSRIEKSARILGIDPLSYLWNQGSVSARCHEQRRSRLLARSGKESNAGSPSPSSESQPPEQQYATSTATLTEAEAQALLGMLLVPFGDFLQLTPQQPMAHLRPRLLNILRPLLARNPTLVANVRSMVNNNLLGKHDAESLLLLGTRKACLAIWPHDGHLRLPLEAEASKALRQQSLELLIAAFPNSLRSLFGSGQCDASLTVLHEALQSHVFTRAILTNIVCKYIEIALEIS